MQKQSFQLKRELTDFTHENTRTLLFSIMLAYANFHTLLYMYVFNVKLFNPKNKFSKRNKNHNTISLIAFLINNVYKT